MKNFSSELQEHLDSGATTICQCWQIIRADNQSLGFTDHDNSVEFEGVTFEPSTGANASALSQSSGLAIDNSEIGGVLDSDRLTERDLIAGLYDGAEILMWVVNWQDVSQRYLMFKGQLGEINHSDTHFEVELLGLNERLNRVVGRPYLRHCTADFSDVKCGFDPNASGFNDMSSVSKVEGRLEFEFEASDSFEPSFFELGRVVWLSGENTGVVSQVKADRLSGTGRLIALRQDTPFDIAMGDSFQIFAGCDKTSSACRSKFDNLENFRGFPFIPGDDWAVAFPIKGDENDGGSLQS